MALTFGCDRKALRPHPNSPTNSTNGCLVNKAHAIAAVGMPPSSVKEVAAARLTEKVSDCKAKMTG